MNGSLSVFGILLIAAALYALLQKSSPTFALMISLGAAVVLLMRVGFALETVLSGLHRMEQQAGGVAFTCLLRCTGIALLTDYARAICEEAGAESLVWCAGFVGRFLILAAAWPLLEEVGQRIWSIAG